MRELNPIELELISEFLRDIQLEFGRKFSPHRVKYYKANLRILKKKFLNSLSSFTLEEVKRAFYEIDQSEYKETTKEDLKRVLKRYALWLSKKKNLGLEELHSIKIKRARRDLPTILSEEEVLRIINSTDNLRDRAMISFLYESGCRAGELLNLRIRDLEFDEFGCKVRLNGKTGERIIRVVFSANALRDYLKTHPLRDDLNSPLWITKKNFTNGESRYEALKYGGLRKVIRTLVKVAGIKKRVSPHTFRHSRVTHLSKKLSDQTLKKYFGWSRDSKMLSVYSHLSTEDLDESYLQLYGIKKKTPLIEEKVRLIELSKSFFIDDSTEERISKTIPIEK
ncbi:hypothetical protein DRN63_01990 [Nanoarchaeota archaeon]|nr:MAG: hypothetical protein DRN63_01990 [Nanoarchaeota archaeon]